MDLLKLHLTHLHRVTVLQNLIQVDPVGWSVGMVEFASNCVLRSPIGGAIDAKKFVASQQIAAAAKLTHRYVTGHVYAFDPQKIVRYD